MLTKNRPNDKQPSKEEQDFIDLFTEDILKYFNTNVIREIMENLWEEDENGN